MSKYLDSHQIRHFIPTVLQHTVDKEGKMRHERVTAIHNLIFIRLEEGIDQVKDVLKQCPYTTYVYSRPDNPAKWHEIPDRDMIELRMICDIDFTEPQFVSAQECELKVGYPVRIIHGPLKNITGKLIRKNKKYYLVRTFGDLGVMVNVSRWCCQPMESEK